MAVDPPQFDLFTPQRNRPVASPAAQPIEPARPPVLAMPSPRAATEIASVPAAAVLSVSELTFQLKGVVEGRFTRVAVLGEVSNCRRQSSGHLYFTLKDDGACVSAMLWRRDAQKVPFELKDGMQVVCQGRIEIYGPHGKYQLMVDRLEPMGDGALALAFEELKKKLDGEGLFAPARKRRLPFLPRCVGVVTSPTGAALRDFLRVLHVRFPGLPVIVSPAKVQGEGAPVEIVDALRRLVRSGEVDVVLLTRGGGSMEDLWAFNDERLARAIAACPVPVVSAVGHEIDFTIADFVADRRAPTPTGAAEILAPSRVDLVADLEVAGQRLVRALGASVQARRQAVLKLRFRLGDPRREVTERKLRLADLTDRLQLAAERQILDRSQRLRRLSDDLQRQSPRETLAARLRALHSRAVALERAGRSALDIDGRRAEVQRQSTRLRRGADGALQRRREALGVARARLDSISPQRVFERGYSLTRDRRRGQVVRASGELRSGDEIEVTVSMREQAGELFEDKVIATVI